ncbi:MAG: M20/M25/M40 family metallo-hydrolase [Spiroplasma sp. hy2]|uniref:M20/M25/M40 family metallo-hydrolase n=1 Tax=Spiroplasma sp. hy2 TaxID=2490850 RepID=UPI003B702179
MFGRGAIDDKGPTIINLYALKYLKDHNYRPDYTIRLIFGLTEETDWASIKAYMETEGVPCLRIYARWRISCCICWKRNY